MKAAITRTPHCGGGLLATAFFALGLLQTVAISVKSADGVSPLPPPLPQRGDTHEHLYDRARETLKKYRTSSVEEGNGTHPFVDPAAATQMLQLSINETDPLDDLMKKYSSGTDHRRRRSTPPTTMPPSKVDDLINKYEEDVSTPPPSTTPSISGASPGSNSGPSSTSGGPSLSSSASAGGSSAPATPGTAAPTAPGVPATVATTAPAVPVAITGSGAGTAAPVAGGSGIAPTSALTTTSPAIIAGRTGGVFSEGEGTSWLADPLDFNMHVQALVDRGAPGQTMVEVKIRTRSVKHASASKVFFALCQTRSDCMEEERLENMLQGRTKLFYFAKPDWVQKTTKIPYVHLTAVNDDAWFPDFLQATIISGQGKPVATSLFEIDGWLEGAPMEAMRDDPTSPGHPLFHRTDLIIGGGPRITVTVWTSKHQRSQNMGFIRLHPCESETQCMLGFVKLRDLSPGTTHTYEANMWQDLEAGKGFMPLAALNGVLLEVADAECSERIKDEECQAIHADDCWQGFELEVTVEGHPESQRTVIPAQGMLCRNPLAMPALSALSGDIDFYKATKVYLAAGIKVWVNITTDADSGSGVLPGSVSMKICASEGKCYGNMTLTDIRPGTNQSYKFIVEDLTKADAVHFIHDGILVQWLGEGGGWHPRKIVVKIEEYDPKTFLTDGWIVANPNMAPPLCVNYWASMRYIRGGTPVRFSVMTGFSSYLEQDNQGPVCATLCKTADAATCLGSSVLLGGRAGALNADGKLASFTGVLEELVQGDSEEPLLMVKFSAASQDSKPWHVTSVKAELVIDDLPATTWSLPYTLLADHWITPMTVSPGRPCWNNWAEGPLVLADEFDRLQMRVQTQKASMPVQGPVCLVLCSDTDGRTCMPEQVAAADLHPGHDKEIYGVVKKGTAVPMTIKLNGAQSGEAWFVEMVGTEVPWKKNFDTNGWVLPEEGAQGPAVQDAIAPTCWNWQSASYTLVKSDAYVVVKALTMSKPASSASPGPVCAHICQAEGSCLASNVPLSNLVPGQWLSYKGVMEDPSVVAGALPAVKGVQLEAKVPAEWFCDKLRVGTIVAPNGVSKTEPDLTEFWVRHWLDNPVETKEYPRNQGDRSLYIGLGPYLQVVTRTRGDVGREAGTNGSIVLWVCQSRSLCLEGSVELTNLVDGEEQTFEIPVYEYPTDFKLKAVYLEARTSDAWYVQTLKVTFLGQELSWTLNGWFVSTVPPPRPLLGQFDFVATSRFLAIGAKGTMQIYSFGRCEGPIEVRPCRSMSAGRGRTTFENDVKYHVKTMEGNSSSFDYTGHQEQCEDGLHFSGSLAPGETVSHEGKVESLYDASSYEAEYLKVTHQGSGECRIGWITFAIEGRDLGMYSVPTEGATMVPASSLDNFDVNYTFSPGHIAFYERLNRVTLEVQTMDDSDAECQGAVAAALCNKVGSLCLSRYIFLAGMQRGTNQTYTTALPMSQMESSFPEWVPASLLLTSLSTVDAWMFDSMTLTGETIEKPLEIFGEGWIAQRTPIGTYPGNFWQPTVLIASGGAKLKLVTLSDEVPEAASSGGILVEVCGMTTLCVGPIRITRLSRGGPVAEFYGPLGELPPDLHELTVVKMTSKTSDTWCSKKVFVQILPVGGAQVPPSLTESREFTAGECFAGNETVILHWGARVGINVTTHVDTGPQHREVGPAEFNLCKSDSDCIGTMVLEKLVPGLTQHFEFVVPELTKEQALAYPFKGLRVTWKGRYKWHLNGISVRIENRKPFNLLTDGWFVPDAAEPAPPCSNYWTNSRYITGGTQVRFHMATAADSPLEDGEAPGPICARLCHGEGGQGCLISSALIGGARAPLVPGGTWTYEAVVEEGAQGELLRPLTAVKLEAARDDSQPWHVEDVRAEVIIDEKVAQSLDLMADHWVTVEGATPVRPCSNNWGLGALTLRPVYERVRLALRSNVESMPVSGRICVSLCSDKQGSTCAPDQISAQGLHPGQDAEAHGLVEVSFGGDAPVSLKLVGAAEGSAWFAESITIEKPWERRYDTSGWLLPVAKPSAELDRLLKSTCWNWQEHTHVLAPTDTFVTIEALTVDGPGSTGSRGPFCAHLCKAAGDCLQSSVALERLTPGQKLRFQGVVDDPSAMETLPAVSGIRIDAKSSEDWFCDKVWAGVTKGVGAPTTPLSEFWVHQWLDNPVELKEYPGAQGEWSVFVGVGQKLSVVTKTHGDAGREGGSNGTIALYVCESRTHCLETYLGLENLVAGAEQTFEVPIYDVPQGFTMKAVRLDAKTTDAWFVQTLTVSFMGKSLSWNLNGWLVSKAGLGFDELIVPPAVSPSGSQGSYSFVADSRFLAEGNKGIMEVYSFGSCEGPIEVRPCSSKDLCEDGLNFMGALVPGKVEAHEGYVDSLYDNPGFEASYLRVTHKGTGECKIGWISFYIGQKSEQGLLGTFSATAEGAELLPASELSAMDELYTFRQGTVAFFEPLDKVSLETKTMDYPNAECTGTVAVALCNKLGSLCLPRYMFLAGLESGKDQTFHAALPLVAVESMRPEWAPAALFLTSLTRDAWMFNTAILSGATISTPLTVYGEGWVSKGAPIDAAYPGNFWQNQVLLTAGGVKLKLTAHSSDGSIAASAGGVLAEVCAGPGLCRGPIRLSKLSPDASGADFFGPLGDIQADFREVRMVKLTSLTEDMWCAKKVFVQILPVGSTQVPPMLAATREFTADACFSRNKSIVLHWGARVAINVTTLTDTGPQNREVGPAKVKLCKSGSDCIGTMVLDRLLPGTTQHFEFVVPELTKEQALAYAFKGVSVTWEGTYKWHVRGISVQIENRKPFNLLTDGWFVPDAAKPAPPCSNYWTNSRYITGGTRVRFHAATAADSVLEGGEAPGPACAKLCYAGTCLESSALLGSPQVPLIPGDTVSYEAVVEEGAEGELLEPLTAVKLQAAVSGSRPWHVEGLKAEVIVDEQVAVSLDLVADHWVTVEDAQPVRTCSNNWGAGALTLQPVYKQVKLTLRSKPQSMAVSGRICVSLCKDTKGEQCMQDRIAVYGIGQGEDAEAHGLVEKSFTDKPASLKLEGAQEGGAWFAAAVELEVPWKRRYDTSGWLLPQGNSDTALGSLLKSTCWNWKEHTHVLAPTDTFVTVEALTMDSPGHTGSHGPFCARLCKSQNECFQSSVALEGLMPGQKFTFKGVLDDPAVLDAVPVVEGIRIDAKTSEEWFCDKVWVGVSNSPSTPAPTMSEFWVHQWLDNPVELKEYPGAQGEWSVFVGVGQKLTVITKTSGDAGREGGSNGTIALFVCESRTKCLETYLGLQGLVAGSEQTFEVPIYDVPQGFEMKAVRLEARTKDAWFVQKLTVKFSSKTLDWDLNGWLVSTVPPARPLSGPYSFIAASRFLAQGSKGIMELYSFGSCKGPIEVRPCSSKNLCEDGLHYVDSLAPGNVVKYEGSVDSLYDVEGFKENIEYLKVTHQGTGECKLGWISFYVEEFSESGFLGTFSASAEGAALVPAQQLSAMEAPYTFEPGSVTFLEPLDKVSLTATTMDYPDAGCTGTVALALCNKMGSLCLNRYMFLSGMSKGSSQDFNAALPLTAMENIHPEWVPAALLMTGLTGDAWMFDTVTVSSAVIETPLVVYGEGWVAQGNPADTAYPGNFWQNPVLLAAGGAKLQLTATSAGDKTAGSAGGVLAEVCATPELCRGPVRLSALSPGSSAQYFGPLGELHADFREVSIVKLRSLTSDTWCVKKVAVKILSVGSSPVPLGLEDEREFTAGDCLSGNKTVVLHWGARVTINVTTHADSGPRTRPLGPAEVQLCERDGECVGKMILQDIIPGTSQSFSLVVPELTKEQALSYGFKGVSIEWKGMEKWHLRGIVVQIEDRKPFSLLTDGWFVPASAQTRPPCVNYWVQSRYITGGTQVRFRIDAALDSEDDAGSPGPICASLCHNTCLDSSALLGGAHQSLVPGGYKIYEAIVEEGADGDMEAPLKGVKFHAANSDSKPLHLEFVRAEVVVAGSVIQSIEMASDHWVTAAGAANAKPCANNWGEAELMLSPGYQRVKMVLQSKPESVVVQESICVSLCSNEDGTQCAKERIAVQGLQPGQDTKAFGLVEAGFSSAPVALKLEGPKEGAAWFAKSITITVPWQRRFDTNGWLLPENTLGPGIADVLKNTCWNWKEHTHVLARTNAYVTVEAFTMDGPANTGSRGPFCAHLCKSKDNCLQSAVALERLTSGQRLTFQGVVDDISAVASLPTVGGVKIEAKTSEGWFCDKVRIGVARGAAAQAHLTDFSIRRWLDRQGPEANKLDGKKYSQELTEQVVFAGLTAKLTATAWTENDLRAGSIGAVEVYPCSSKHDCLDAPISLRDLKPGQSQTFEAGAVAVPVDFKPEGILVVAKTSDSWYGSKLRVTVAGKALQVNLGGWFVSNATVNETDRGEYIMYPKFLTRARFFAPNQAASAEIYSPSGCQGPILLRPCTAPGDCESYIQVNGPWSPGQVVSGSGEITTLVNPGTFKMGHVEVRNLGKEACSFSTIKFVVGSNSKNFGAPTEGAKLVPMAELDPTVPCCDVAPGATVLLDAQELVTFKATSTSSTHAGCRGLVAAALCDKAGLQCMNRFAYLSGMVADQTESIEAALPMTKVSSVFADWVPAGFFLANTGGDPWMVASLEASGSGIQSTVVAVGEGWVARQPPSHVTWPGNFWLSRTLLPGGGAKLSVTVRSMGGSNTIAASVGEVWLEVCAREGLCRGSLRLTSLPSGSGTATYSGSIGDLPEDFDRVRLVKLNTSSAGAWCIRDVKVQLLPAVPTAILPSTVSQDDQTFHADGCLSTDAGEKSRSHMAAALNLPLIFYSQTATLKQGGPKLTLEVKTMPNDQAGDQAGSSGPIEVALCTGRNRCINPVMLRDLTAGGTQTFEYQLPAMEDSDFVPIGVLITAKTDDAWYADTLKVVALAGQSLNNPELILSGWFEEFPDPSRHAGVMGRFVTREHYFGMGPKVTVTAVTGSEPQAGSKGPFDVVICQSTKACLDGSPITLTDLTAGSTQNFVGNVPELINFPDFQVGGMQVVARSKDAWAPSSLTATVEDNGATLQMDLHAWFDAAPMPPNQYPKVAGGLTAYFAKDRIYLDSCTMKSCQRDCQLALEWDAQGKRRQTGTCQCVPGEVLQDDGRTCADQTRLPPPPPPPVGR